MKIPISDLNQVQMTWAFATIDPLCEGLRWSVMNNTIVGSLPDESLAPESVAIFIHAGNFMKTTKLKHVFKYADHYSPIDNWNQLGARLNDWKPNITWKDAKTCSATLVEDGELITGTGPNIQSAILQAKLIAHFGNNIDIPDEIYALTAPATPTLDTPCL